MGMKRLEGEGPHVEPETELGELLCRIGKEGLMVHLLFVLPG